VVKRIVDVWIASVALAIFSPLIGVIALLVRCLLGRPVFFIQRRPGLYGKLFTLYKFRTMSDIRDQSGTVLPDYARITRFGSILRSSSLDELPQLWNVFKGEMSLVGPRPLAVAYLSRYSPFQQRRHETKPGITGWAQIHGRNALTWEERFQLDVWYVDHRSLGLDLNILVLTVWKVFRCAGISQAGHVTMPEFLGGAAQVKKT
jgi:sugar transferase EpsL